MLAHHDRQRVASSNRHIATSPTCANAGRICSPNRAIGSEPISLAAPPPPAGSFDAAAAARGKAIFEGAGKCATCHSGTTFTDASATLHPPGDSMAEPEAPSYASRSATKLYRTTPLKGAWQHAPYFHNGSAATLQDAVQAYNTKQLLGLTPAQVTDVAEYLKSL
jgi:mono/diheme cytochrome c family protein